MDNTTLIAAFVDGVVTHRTRYIINPELKLDSVEGQWQLTAKSEGLIGVSWLAHRRPRVAIRHRSAYWQDLHAAMLRVHYLPVGKAQRAGFYEYQQIDVPPGYQVRFTDALDIMQAWWAYQTPTQSASLVAMLVLHRGTWHPVRNVSCDQGTLLIHTLGHVVKLLPLERLAWLQRRNLEKRTPADDPPLAIALPPITPNAQATTPQATFPGPGSRLERRPTDAIPLHAQRQSQKKIGSYLVDADLLTPAQVEVALCDQRSTGLKFGEVLVQRGWLKQKTIEFLMERVILPQRALERQRKGTARPSSARAAVPPTRRTYPPTAAPSAAPLPSIHARETLITESFVAENSGPRADNASTQPEDLTIHSRQTLITDAPVTDIEPETPSIHSRQTLVTDHGADTLDSKPSDQRADDNSVNSRVTLITDADP